MRKWSRWKGLFLGAAVLLALAGCGGGEGDETVPDLELTDFPSGAVSADSVVLAGTIEPGAGLEVTVNTVADVSGPTVVGGGWTATIGNLQEGINTVTLKAVDGDGNIHIIKVGVERDTTPPTVLQVAPEGTGVTPGANVRVTFSEEVKGESLVGNFFLTDAAGNPVAGSIAPASGLGQVATFDPAADLAPGQTYRVTVNDAILDQMDFPLQLTDDQGQPLAEKSWTFTTAP